MRLMPLQPRWWWLPAAAMFTTGQTATAQRPARVFPRDSLWRRVWSAGMERDDATFVEPRAVAVSGGTVIVLDRGTREVRTFEARTGRPLSTIPARGSGPGEFKRPAALVATPAGYAVLDHDNARLTGFTVRGALQWDVVVPDQFSITDFCVRTGADILLAYERRDSSLVVVDTAGRIRPSVSIPWRVARPSRVRFAHQGFFSPASAGGACVLAPYHGREWAVIWPTPTGGVGRIDVRPYIEPGEEPVIRASERVVARSLRTVTIQGSEGSETPPIAKGALVRGDTVIIVGARTKQDAHRLLDYYDLRTGRYYYSRRLPFSFVALALGGDGTFYGTLIQEDTQALLAFRPESLTREVQAELARQRAKVTRPPRDTGGRRPGPAPGPGRGSR